jgi:hypothetical protein
MGLESISPRGQHQILTNKQLLFCDTSPCHEFKAFYWSGPNVVHVGRWMVCSWCNMILFSSYLSRNNLASCLVTHY